MATQMKTRSDPTFRPMREANALLGDHDALQRQFDEDGYLFFRGVLDPAAIARLRAVYVDELSGKGLLDADDPQLRYNGSDLARFPARGGTISLTEGLPHKEPWRAFVADPAVNEFFRSVLESDPFWLPIVEYKAIAPASPGRQRFDLVHQDSFYNEGIAFNICWIPLSNIDADVGGLAVAEGLHKGPTLHDVNDPPYYPVPAGSVPDDAWVRADYKPGDLVMMKLNTPHSGLSNISEDRFRLSMDIRVLPRSGPVPVVGDAVDVTPDHVVVRSGDDGKVWRFAIDEKTYLRNLDARREPREAAAEMFAPGTPLIVAAKGEHATVVRRQH